METTPSFPRLSLARIQIIPGIGYDSLVVVVAVIICQAFVVGLRVVDVTVVFELESVAAATRRFPFRLSSGFGAFTGRRSRLIFRSSRRTIKSSSRIRL